ncbi:DEAD/DEAH box helicase [Lacticaseibacillus baoqingensis]|uniref:DEAD/DEAH box helicase n=1 Tax=Lacticaseibacillus baoqingensis TaxID=2486013 RepID=A0ABW4E7D3_9LACO|nr:DEAD/DEAH box helicase [Lacticaseibacillus baoqingensis]
MVAITKAAASKIVAELKQLQAKQATLTPINQALANQLAEAADSLYQREQADALAHLTVKELAGLSYQLDPIALADQGIGSLGKLLETIHQQNALPGVSDRSELQSITTQAEKIAKNLRAAVKLKIDFDAYATESARLVHYVRINEAVGQFLQAQATQSRELTQRIDEVTNKLDINTFGRIRWWLTPEKAKAAQVEKVETISQLNTELAAWYTACFDQINHYTSYQIAVERAEFEHSAAALYAQFEALKLPGTATPVFDQTMIPRSLAAKVEAIEYDTTYLKATLRGWQQFGVKFILANHKVLLGDEMGLGKTVQALAAIAAKRAEGVTHFLVVCPNSIVINWLREIKTHTHISAINLHGAPAARAQALAKWVTEGGIAVCNYEAVWRLDKQKVFDNTQFLVADEAHMVKNPGRKRSDFVTSLAEAVPMAVFMTGTALENHLEDMINLIAPLAPDILDHYGLAEVDRGDGFLRWLRQDELDTLESSGFKKMIAPVYLRRNRADVLKELPAITQTLEWSEFSPYQAAEYKRAVQERGFMAMRQVGWAGQGSKDTPKLERLKEICAEAATNHEKVLFFSFFRQVLQRVAHELSDIAVAPIMGGVATSERQARIDEFIHSSTKFVMPAQIDTLGYGLNLQAANIVIFAEPQLKPSTEAQALSRAYRMGQTKHVFVYRLLTEDSVDELMLAMLDSKQRLFDIYAKDSVAARSSAAAVDPDEVKLEKQILAHEAKRLAV